MLQNKVRSSLARTRPIYVHKGGLKPDSFHFFLNRYNSRDCLKVLKNYLSLSKHMKTPFFAQHTYLGPMFAEHTAAIE